MSPGIKSKMFKSGDRAGHAAGPFRPIHYPATSYSRIP